MSDAFNAPWPPTPAMTTFTTLLGWGKARLLLWGSLVSCGRLAIGRPPRWLPAQCRILFRRRCSAFVVGRAILPAAAFQAGPSGREGAYAGQRPAESRLQPGLAAPQSRRDVFRDRTYAALGCQPAPHHPSDSTSISHTPPV